MRVLVAGAKGQVGNSLVELSQSMPFNLISLERESMDVSIQTDVEEVFNIYRPDILINAAAYTQVNQAELESEKAFLANHQGSKNLAEMCFRHGIPMIHISTDYIFDGLSDVPYIESDKANPKSVYGKSKLLGEQSIEAILKEYIIIRTSWVFALAGCNFINTILKLAQSKEVIKVVNDQRGGPTSSNSIAILLLNMVMQYKKQKKLPWGLYHFCQSPYVTWFDLANFVVKEAVAMKLIGDNVQVVPISSKDYGAKVSRPKNSCLDCSKIIDTFDVRASSWQDDVVEMLEKTKASRQV